MNYDLQIQNKNSNSFLSPMACMCMYIRILTVYIANFLEQKNFNGKTQPTFKGILDILECPSRNAEPAFWLWAGWQT